MKKFLNITAYIVLVVIILSQNFLLKLKDTRSDILYDQLGDFAEQIYQLKSAKTYEDGLRDGFNNRQNPSYVSGYHAALKDQNVFSQALISDGN